MSEPRWEVRWIEFEEGASAETVNEKLATVAAGWEPFAAMPMRDKGWVLLVRRKWKLTE